jgi:hypothetical protein
MDHKWITSSENDADLRQLHDAVKSLGVVADGLGNGRGVAGGGDRAG